MNWKKFVTAYGVHCEGEVGRVVTGGVLNVPGRDMLEKMNYINTIDDSLLKFLVFEPRGCSAGSTNLLFPPSHPDAHAAFIILQPGGAYAMSGSNSMCVVTALVETGMLTVLEGESLVTLETAAGLIPIDVEVKGSKVVRSRINMCPSFAEHLDHPLELGQLGKIVVDIAFGGCFYVLVDVLKLGLSINKGNAMRLGEIGRYITDAANEQLTVKHPEIDAFNRVDYVMFTDIVDKQKGIYRNCTVVPPGRVDRSPCGTGSSARMAVMHAKGALDIGREAEMRLIIDSRFMRK